jgi:hypothetical protein
MPELVLVESDFYVDRGYSFMRDFIILDKMGNAVNLAGCSARAFFSQYSETAETECQAVIVNSRTGSAVMVIDSSITQLMSNTRYVYRIEILSGSDIIKVRHGFLMIR